MKKIAIVASSVALSAMPVVGVFAANTTYTSIADKIQLTVNKTCQMEASDALEVQITTGSIKGTAVTLGGSPAVAGTEFTEVNGTPMTITCNAQAGWTLSAVATSLSASGTSQTIPFGAYPASITPNTTPSVWSAKVALSGNDTANATITDGWSNYGGTAATSTTILQAAGETGAKAAVNGLVVTPSYKGYAANNQAAGSYSGTITYTFADLSS